MKEYKYIINGKEYAVTIQDQKDGMATVMVNGKSYEVETIGQPAPQVAKPVSRPSAPNMNAVGSSAPVAPAASASAGGGVKSPLPGIIVDICVAVGDTVKRGQKVAVLEAMKMENVINAESDGKVIEIKVNKGDSILEGSDIMIIG